MPTRQRQMALFGASDFEGIGTSLGDAERWMYAQGFTRLMGVDEVGRGPLAGDVVAAAVVLPVQLPRALFALDDSKKLSGKTRRALVPLIKEHALAYGVGRASPETIDRVNILQATFIAMRAAIDCALQQLTKSVDIVLVDGHQKIPKMPYEQCTLKKGDRRSYSIAAASVLAKVQRDSEMIAADKLYPEYGFAQHKGYGTREHREALTRYGETPLHRRSFKWSPISS